MRISGSLVADRSEVVIIEVAKDVCDKLRDALEAAQTDDLAGNFTEEVLHPIGPRARCGREMKMEARGASDPSFDLGILVCGAVAADDVDILVHAHRSIDFSEKGQPFVGTVAIGRMSKDFAAEVVQSRKKRHRAVAVIVMGTCANMTLSERCKPVCVRSSA